MGARVEAGRLGKEAILVVQTPDVGSLDWEGVMEVKSSASGFGWDAESMRLFWSICVCGKLFPKMVAATSFILHASAVGWLQDFVLLVECKRNDILGLQEQVLRGL